MNKECDHEFDDKYIRPVSTGWQYTKCHDPKTHPRKKDKMVFREL